MSQLFTKLIEFRFYTPHSQCRALSSKGCTGLFLFLSHIPPVLFSALQRIGGYPMCVFSLRMSRLTGCWEHEKNPIPPSCTSGGSACFSFEFNRQLTSFPVPSALSGLCRLVYWWAFANSKWLSILLPLQKKTFRWTWMVIYEGWTGLQT